MKRDDVIPDDGDKSPKTPTKLTFELKQHCNNDCKYNGKDEGKMLRCCVCMVWHHFDCMGENPKSKITMWSCLTCRMIPTMLQKLLKDVESLKSVALNTKSDAEIARLLSEQQTLSQEKTKLKEQIDILTAEKITLEQENSQLKLNLKKSDSSPESVPVTVCQDTEPRNVLTDQSDDIKKSLLVGSSIVQDIRAKSDDNLDVIFKRGGTLNTVKNILRQTSMTK